VIPAPTGTVILGDGRRLSYDDVGDPSGAPVVYLHGCPDCRLTRHPDDGLATRAGVRLIAVDRPGYGASDADDNGDENALAADVVALADALDIDRFAVLGWSSGGPGALALAARHPERVAVAGVAAGQVPMEADADPEVRGALDPVIAARADVIAEMTPDEFACSVAPLVVAPGLTIELARDLVVDGKPAEYLHDLDSVDGLLDQLALGTMAAAEHGLAGVERDMRGMVSPWPFDLSSITTPVVLWYGSDDATFGPAAGRWLAGRIPTARLEVVRASHLLPLVRWESILTVLSSHLDRREEHATQP
jgi:pimeloyl-ACP methyl ester carboxylesterase